MAKPPYFPFYPKDFAADAVVELMSTPAVGAYILLMCKAWHSDPPASLPDDDRVLARFARMTPDDWLVVRSEVLPAFAVGSDGRLHQKRLRSEYDKFAAKSKSARDSANRRWEAQRAKEEENDANALPPHCEGNARASGSGSDISPSSKKKKEAEDAPDAFGLFWAAWPPNARKRGEQQCARHWAAKRLSERSTAIMDALALWLTSAEWLNEDGKYIPAPLKWLNESYFEATPTPGQSSSKAKAAAWDALGADAKARLLADVQAAEPSVDHCAGNIDTIRAMKRRAEKEGLI